MRVRRLVLFTAALAVLAACGSGGTTSSSGAQTPNPQSRPSSPAVLRIVSPTSSETIAGATVHVVVSLESATVVKITSPNIRPDQGHVHLYLDNQLIYMQYSLQQDVAVRPGTYSLKAEFVASDHFPFNPRVWSQTVIFTVR